MSPSTEIAHGDPAPPNGSPWGTKLLLHCHIAHTKICPTTAPLFVETPYSSRLFCIGSLTCCTPVYPCISRNSGSSSFCVIPYCILFPTFLIMYVTPHHTTLFSVLSKSMPSFDWESFTALAHEPVIVLFLHPSKEAIHMLSWRWLRSRILERLPVRG